MDRPGGKLKNTNVYDTYNFLLVPELGTGALYQEYKEAVST